MQYHHFVREGDLFPIETSGFIFFKSENRYARKKSFASWTNSPTYHIFSASETLVHRTIIIHTYLIQWPTSLLLFVLFSQMIFHVFSSKLYALCILWTWKTDTEKNRNDELDWCEKKKWRRESETKIVPNNNNVYSEVCCQIQEFACRTNTRIAGSRTFAFQPTAFIHSTCLARAHNNALNNVETWRRNRKANMHIAPHIRSTMTSWANRCFFFNPKPKIWM